ncbi:MAG TPA: hypothetical protein VFH39_04925 [Candidatus Saccharimonadales bacterium]|nr:hypothetical protein [Candidatus Saccharimonadales bacterium]
MERGAEAEPPVEVNTEQMRGVEPSRPRLTAHQHHYLVLGQLYGESNNASDPVMRAAFTAVCDELHTNKKLYEALLVYSQANRDDSVSAATRKIYSSLQQFVIPLPQRNIVIADEHAGMRVPTFPEGFEDPARWSTLIRSITGNIRSLSDFRLTLIDKELQSNVVSRYIPPRVAAQLFGLSNLDIYSGGASFGIVEKMEKLYKPGRYRLPLTISVGQLGVNGRWDFTPSDTLTGDYCRLLNAEYKVGQIIAGDIDPVLDPLTATYAYSNSFRPSEFGNRQYRKIVDRLLVRHVPGMRYTKGGDKGDFTHPKHVDYIREAFPSWFNRPGRKVQFLTSSYIIHEEHEALRQAEANARDLAGDEGVIFWMDFCHRSPNGELNFIGDKWQDGDYNLYALDMQNQSAGKQHIFTFREGRAAQVAPGEDLKRKMNAYGGRLVAGMMRDAA